MTEKSEVKELAVLEAEANRDELYLEYGWRKRTAMVLGRLLDRARRTRYRAEGLDEVYSRTLGMLMRMYRKAVLQVGPYAIKKEEVLAIPDGGEGQEMLYTLLQQFGKLTILGLYKYEIEVIPAHVVEVSVLGGSPHFTRVPEKTEIRYTVNDTKSRKLDQKTRTAIAKAIGNRPRIRVERLPESYKPGEKICEHQDPITWHYVKDSVARCQQCNGYVI